MLSLVLPTYNEAENLSELLPKVEDVLKDIPHEIIIVDDDSPDGTWRVAQELSERLENVHVIRRIGRRGLSSAVVEGFLAAKGDVLAVADADGQHDFVLLPQLYESIQNGSNIAIGSRYAEGGSVGEWDERRHALSRFATKLAIALCKVKAADPMSGFFAIDRQTFETTLSKLNPKGFKILLDFLVHVPKSTRVKELPFTFGKRLHGESKLSRRVQIEFIEYLYDVYRRRPYRGRKWGALAWHFLTRHFTKALSEVRKKWDAIEVDRLQVKPRVKITGEFWLQTHEGDGNYSIKRWLEAEDIR